MVRLHFPEPFKRRHPPAKSVEEILEERLTFGQRAADWVARTVGSWPVILAQSAPPS